MSLLSFLELLTPFLFLLQQQRKWRGFGWELCVSHHERRETLTKMVGVVGGVRERGGNPNHTAITLTIKTMKRLRRERGVFALIYNRTLSHSEPRQPAGALIARLFPIERCVCSTLQHTHGSWNTQRSFYYTPPGDGMREREENSLTIGTLRRNCRCCCCCCGCGCRCYIVTARAPGPPARR